MSPGTTLELQTVDPGHHPIALGGLIIEVLLFVNGKNRYQFDVGETAASGSLIVTFDKLDAIRRNHQNFALMDYNATLDSCDDVIDIVAPTERELRKELESVERWFPENAPELRKRIDASANRHFSVAACHVSLKDKQRLAQELVCSEIRSLHEAAR